MNEQNRLRLDRMAARLAKHGAEAGPEPRIEREPELNPDAAYLAAFTRVRDAVLRPVMGEVGEQLEREGYSFRISPGGDEGSPAVDFHVVLPERGDSKDTIRFFAHKDTARGWQVIAELELKRNPFELTRFENTDEITHDVAEQLIVDAVEQMFASTAGPPRGEGPPAAQANEPAVAHAATVEASDQGGTQETAQGGENAASSVELLPLLAEAPPPALPPLTREPEMRWARWAGAQELGETEEVSVSAFRGAALPFVEGPPPPAFFAAADATSIGAHESATGYETILLPGIDLQGVGDQAPGAQATPSLTVEQYAALCAESTVFPDQAASIQQRYGINTVDARVALYRAFAERFRADPTLQRRWQALVAHYANWYRGTASR